MTDTDFMQRAIELAKRGIGAVNPNPLVGAVIVRDGKILAEGWHERCGELHAERNAIKHFYENNIDGNLKGATIYVTLEPCCHYGKTPPCTEAIIENGFRRVVIGSDDPNPLVAGKGIRILRDAGIEVETGVGKIFADDPMLNCRLEGGGRNPVRIVCDTNLRTPLESNVVLTAGSIRTIIATACADERRMQPYINKGCEIITVQKREGVQLTNTTVCEIDGDILLESEVSKGIASVSLQNDIPVMFGVLTTENIEQAIERAGTKAGNKGFDCATGAIEMVNLMRQIG